MGPLQPVSHLLQKRHTVPQAAHWGRTNKELKSFKMEIFFVYIVLVRCLQPSVVFLYHVTDQMQI